MTTRSVAAAISPLAPTRTGHRPAGWATLHSLTCPNGHHIKHDQIVLEHGGIRCKSRDPLHTPDGRKPTAGVAGAGPECGAWLYVLASIGWTVERDAASGCDRIVLGDDVFVAAVTYRELEEIRRHRWSATKVLDFLNVPRFQMLPAT